jgi:hypothetical protein
MRNAKTRISPAVLAALTASAILLVVFQAAAVTQRRPVKSGQKADTLLFVRTTPTGAEVQLDGKKLGTSDGLFPVEPGEYKIVVDLQGHQPHEQNITVRDGRITRIELTLKQSASDVSLGAARAQAAYPSQDEKLTEAQRLFRDWTEEFFRNQFTPTSLDDKAAKEKLWIQQLNTLKGRDTIPAISGLATIRSRKAVPGLLKIASERREKDNRDRWMAVRALGLVGDKRVVPELVHLTYHYNQNTRFWAQISLVRLTGENFGRDVAAWSQWWEKQGGKPAISTETISWTTNAEWADPKRQNESDRQFVDRMKARVMKPQIVSMSPANGAKDVDPKVREIRVTFNMPMAGGFSWTGGGPQFPTVPNGKRPYWSEDRKTCVLPVSVKPGSAYRLGLNSPSHKNFQSEGGIPLEPVEYTFSTRGQ